MRVAPQVERIVGAGVPVMGHLGLTPQSLHRLGGFKVQGREREQAQVFDVLLRGQPARGFALRFDGQVVAYVNRCVHVPTEMDWQEGRFLDMDRRWIVCSIHGATYEPAGGRCVGGPCGRGRRRRSSMRPRSCITATFSSSA